MSLTTSTISHEMRNPLNSLISQCKIQDQNIEELDELVSLKLSQREILKYKNIRKNLFQSNHMQTTCANLL